MAPRLRRSNCSKPGITRRRHGRGFVYFDCAGERVTDSETLDRIRSLVIPPAWTDVWICTDPNGHIQATGFDARGRRQYRYHDRWRVHRDREKFDHMLAFAEALPGLRQQTSADLALEGLPRERVLACAVRLLDLGFFRIGTEGYAQENQTYGLATIQRRHVSLDPKTNAVTFDYVSKSGKRRVQAVADPEVFDVVETLKRRRHRSPELLAWRGGRRWIDVRSADINAYIKEVTGGDFTAKDFRTWSATLLAAVALGVSRAPASATAGKRAVTRAVKEVAHYLGNTPAVCRASYIDPRVVDCYVNGETVENALMRVARAPVDPAVLTGSALLTQGGVERAVVRMLTQSDAVAQAA